MGGPATVNTPLSGLVAYDDNPRNISTERLGALKRSMTEDPEMLWARPVLALPDGRVICGNMRLRAAQELGWADIPAITVDLDETKARVWALRDNNQYGYWDDDQLGFFLAELAMDVDLELTGFSPEEIERLMGEASSPPRGPHRKTEVLLMEIDPVYCDVIRQRYADYTNQPQYAP